MTDERIPLTGGLANVRTTQPGGAFLLPFQHFASIQAAGGLLLLIATLTALLWANSPWSASYNHVWETELQIGLGGLGIAEPLHVWINDGLMAVFFFVLGLEIKRELLVGELTSWRQAALPLLAALGGMAVPAGIYLLINAGGSGADGWGIPMATDTAFALGILALLGSRIPITLKILLTALAIIDDIGALLVIALFYTAEIAWLGLVAAAGVIVLVAVANWSGLRHPVVYAVLGTGLWLAFRHAGIHPTIAGVVLAAMTPAWSHIGTHQFLEQARDVLHRYEAAGASHESVLANQQRQAAFLELGIVTERAETPLQRLEHQWHPWATFLIMPLFALANAGLELNSGVVTGLTHPVGLGVAIALVVGKPVGIVGCAWLAVKTRVTVLPPGLDWRHIAGIGSLAGFGFTMSLFVANLAFGGTPLVTDAKIGILVGSMISGFVGWALLRGTTAAPTTTRRDVEPWCARSCHRRTATLDSKRR